MAFKNIPSWWLSNIVSFHSVILQLHHIMSGKRCHRLIHRMILVILFSFSDILPLVLVLLLPLIRILLNTCFAGHLTWVEVEEGRVRFFLRGSCKALSVHNSAHSSYLTSRGFGSRTVTHESLRTCVPCRSASQALYFGYVQTKRSITFCLETLRE